MTPHFTCGWSATRLAELRLGIVAPNGDGDRAHDIDDISCSRAVHIGQPVDASWGLALVVRHCSRSTERAIDDVDYVQYIAYAIAFRVPLT